MTRLLFWVVPDDVFQRWVDPIAALRFHAMAVIESSRRDIWLVQEMSAMNEQLSATNIALHELLETLLQELKDCRSG